MVYWEEYLFQIIFGFIILFKVLMAFSEYELLTYVKRKHKEFYNKYGPAIPFLNMGHFFNDLFNTLVFKPELCPKDKKLRELADNYKDYWIILLIILGGILLSQLAPIYEKNYK